MKFKLEIDLGNAAMQSFGDIANALLKVSNKLDERNECGQTPNGQDLERIRDVNGNTVGKWKLTGRRKRDVS